MKAMRKFYLLLILFVLVACVPNGGLWGVPEGATTPTFTAPPPPTVTDTPAPTAIPSTETVTATPVPRAARVLIVSFDGLRPDAIAKAPMTNLLTLMHASQSAYTLNAQTVLPSVTLPAHSSMLTGLCPSSHGVTWDEYLPEKGYARGTGLFNLAHAAGLRTVMVVGKEKLRQVTEPANTDVFAFVDGSEDDVAQRAIQEMPLGFGVMFVHFPQGDLAGHAYGWLSQKQLQAYREGDDAFGKLLAELDFDGLRASTLIVVTSDHGGHKTTHGSDMPEDVTIPWIVNGPFVHAGQLSGYVHTTDTAATAAFMLGLPRPADWDGRPVYEAFGLPTEPRAMPVCIYDK